MPTKDCEFVRLRNKPVDVKSVAGTNFCDLFVTKNGNALFVSSAIDNLFKRCFFSSCCKCKYICGYEEYEGIPKIAYVP